VGCHGFLMRPVGHRSGGWIHCRLLAIRLSR
jgi:hypothetical protein